MTFKKTILAGAACALLAASALTPSLAFAQQGQIYGNGALRPLTVRRWGYTDTKLNSSVSSTTLVNVLSVTGTPINDPNGYSTQGYLGGAAGNLGLNGDTGGAGYSKPYEHIRVTWTADVNKATSTTGYCELYVNGALYAPSLRTASYAGGNEDLADVVDVPISVTGAQTVSLQCASADTATLTINNASMTVDEAY